VTALKAFGADRMGMSEELQQEIVDKWRKSNPHIVSYWKRVERAAIAAVQGSTTTLGCLTFTYRNGTLWVRLPSGRSMAYAGARFAESTRKQGKVLSYMGVDQKTRQWTRVETWGGKLVENLVQAIARDILRDKMLALNALGYDIRAHVHDEVILSVPWTEVGSERVSAIMGAELPWTHGLPLSAESYECEYYQKD
jgi:DNA polymerase